MKEDKEDKRETERGRGGVEKESMWEGRMDGQDYMKWGHII